MPQSDAFASWLARKNRFERGLKLLKVISPTRLDDGTYEGRDLFERLMIASMAIDCSLGLLEAGRDETKTMQRAFRSWVHQNHTFCNVEIKRDIFNKLTSGGKAIFIEVGHVLRRV